MGARPVLIFILICLASSANAGPRDACRQSDEALIAKRADQENGFKYESRVEKADERGNTLSGKKKLYMWCVENLNKDNIFLFQWGTVDHPIKYFDKPAAPRGVPAIMKGEYPFDHAVDVRRIRSKRDHWTRLQPWENVDVQTVFYKDTILKAPPKGGPGGQSGQAGTIQLAQHVEAESQHVEAEPDVTDEIVRLSDKKGALIDYIDREGFIRFFFETTLMVPVNLETRKLLSKGQYKKYNDDDFAVANLLLENIVKNINGEAFSILKLTILSETKSPEENSRVRKALTINPVSVDFQSDDPTHRMLAPSLKVGKVDTGVRFILRKPAERLLFAPFEMRILDAKQGAVLASMPVNLFIPSQITTSGRR